MNHPLNPPAPPAARDGRLHDAAARTARVAAEWPRAALQARQADLPPIRSGWAAGGAHSGHSDPTAAQALADDPHYPNHLADLTAARRDYLTALGNLERLIAMHRPAPNPLDRERARCDQPDCTSYSIALGKCRKHYDQARNANKANV